MSTLNHYIEYVKEQTKNLTEIEKIRWIYIDLGKRFSFDLKFASGGNSTQKAIYRASAKPHVQDVCFETNTGICKSIALIFERILKSNGIKCTTASTIDQEVFCPHVNNMVKLKDGTTMFFDLQRDLENIRTHSTTRKFGILTETGEFYLSRFELEQIDKKIGYIGPNNYYSDEYLYLLKSDMGLYEDFSEKAEFVITNLEPVYEEPVKYMELKGHHDRLLRLLFKPDELKKIHQIDCYYKNGDEKSFIPTIYVDSGNKTDIYMHNAEEQRYEKVSMEEFVEKKENGLIHTQGIPRLRQFLTKRKFGTNDER